MHHGGLLVQRGQVGGAGDIASHGAGKVVNVQRYAIFGDGGPQDGNVRRRGHGRLQRSGGVGQNQVHISGHKGIDDSGAGVGITCGVLHIKGDRVAQLLGQRVNKALGGGIQRVVGDQLAHAHGISLSLGQDRHGAEQQHCRHQNGNEFLHKTTSLQWFPMIFKRAWPG